MIVPAFRPAFRQPVPLPSPHRPLAIKLPAPAIAASPGIVRKFIAKNQLPPAARPVPRPVQAVLEAPRAVDLEVPQHAPPPLTAELPVAPKIEVHTGAFEQAPAPAAIVASGAVSVGAFGVGAGAQPEGASGNSRTAVRLGGFGDQTVPPAESRVVRPPQASAYTPVEILFKPKPVYTKDARNSRVEGEVSLEVVFLATGAIRVGRVVHGLGYGLDEAAQQAAALVRFKPATRGGVPVDTPATIRITFALT